MQVPKLKIGQLVKTRDGIGTVVSIKGRDFGPDGFWTMVRIRLINGEEIEQAIETLVDLYQLEVF